MFDRDGLTFGLGVVVEECLHIEGDFRMADG